MGDKEVHRNVLAVDVAVHHRSDGRRHPVRVEIQVELLGGGGCEGVRGGCEGGGCEGGQ